MKFVNRHGVKLLPSAKNSSGRIPAFLLRLRAYGGGWQR